MNFFDIFIDDNNNFMFLVEIWNNFKPENVFLESKQCLKNERT